MCIRSVFESINSIRHNDIVREAIPHVYDTITEKNFSAVRIYVSLQVTYYYCLLWNIHLSHFLLMLELPVDHISVVCTFLSYRPTAPVTQSEQIQLL